MKVFYVIFIILAVLYFRFRYEWIMDNRQKVALAVYTYNSVRMRTYNLHDRIPYWKVMEPWQVTMIRFWDYNWKHMVNKEYLAKVEAYVQDGDI